MANQTTTYKIPDPAAVAAKITAMGGPQLDVTQPTGEASYDGVTLGWSIENGIITVTILTKPWLVPTSTIWEHVDALFT